MRKPNAADVAAPRQLAKTRPAEAAARMRGVDPLRLAKAADGLVKIASTAIATYFEANAAVPFKADGWTHAIDLKHIPSLFAVTALGQELKATHSNDARLAALTEPLRKILDTKGYGARFDVANVGGDDAFYLLQIALRQKETR